ncbi:hypothetical protein JGU66_24550 [Myxococcaceae bacterium JPH2]|nr:hypothetical protein [Myxococcaceae bacterium JPH2]
MAVPRAARAGPLCLVGWLLATAPASVWAAPPASADSDRTENAVVDRVVAVIEGQVLTLSELDFEARVALVQQGAVQAASDPLDEETLRRSLDLAISQRLLVLTADRLQAFPVEPSDVETRLVAFQARLGGPEALRRFLALHDMDREGLAVAVARMLRAERILDSRVRIKAQASETEVRQYYDSHRAEFPGEYDQAARTAIRDRLVRARYNELAARVLAEARSAAQVRRVAAFAREARR